MGKVTGIEWCHHTLNPWRGCAKVSEGCANCYAEAQSKRNPAVLGSWGEGAPRAFATEKYMAQALLWDAEAFAANERRRVFCGSLMDVWENRDDLIEPRCALLETIARTPSLDWLLLTKRPENWQQLMSQCVYRLQRSERMLAGEELALWWLQGTAPANVWIGFSAENQRRLDERAPHALAIPARVHFVSAEPLLGPLDLRRVLPNRFTGYPKGPRVNWVIVGGESGPHARRFDVDWAHSISDQCAAADTAFFMKHLGHNPNEIHLNTRDEEWDGIPPALRCREFPTPYPV